MAEFTPMSGYIGSPVPRQMLLGDSDGSDVVGAVVGVLVGAGLGAGVGSEEVGTRVAVSYGSQSPHFAQCLGKSWLRFSQVRVQIEEVWDAKHRGRVGLEVGSGVGSEVVGGSENTIS